MSVMASDAGMVIWTIACTEATRKAPMIHRRGADIVVSVRVILGIWSNREE